MGEVTPFVSAAECEYREYVRLVEVMNADMTFENAAAAAKQWWRFMAEYDGDANDAYLSAKMLEPHQL